jgi:hypothetical protein
MGKELLERDERAVEGEREDAPITEPPAAPVAAEQAEAWGGSPETAAAKESVRRDAETAIESGAAPGAPMAAPVQARMEAALGADFSGVTIHPDDPSVGALGAAAATHDGHIHLAPGAPQPGTPEGDQLIAHELRHVQQERAGAGGGAAATVGVKGNAAEDDAEKAAAAAVRGEAVPEAPAAPGGAIQLGEAGVHRGIELDAAGMPTEYDPDKLTPQQKASLEMYSGNFMRDYSQLAAPMPLKILQDLPSSHEGGVVGAGGARTLMDALVRSIAILELGKETANKTVKHENINVYQAEHHLDNPMGTSGPGDFITGGATPQLAASPKAIKTTDAHEGDTVAPVPPTAAETATAATHTGSAVPGLQFENPELYKVGEGGLGNHLANSTEHCKNRMLDAVQLGPTAEGRMNVGMGLHIVEDYFSHTNFIEVGLNSYINEAMAARAAKRKSRHADDPVKGAAIDKFVDGFVDKEGKPLPGAGAQEQGAVHAEFAFVDTLYDVKTPDGKQAVTTGTFGGTDTKVSIGHTLLPKLPKLEAALHRGVDSTMGVVDQAAKEKKPPTWEVIQGMLEGRGRDGAIAQVMLEASNSVGLAVPCPSGFDIVTKPHAIPLLGTWNLPDHVDLTYTNIPITDALVTGAGTYVAVMSTLDKMKKATGIIGLEKVITAAQEAIKAAMQKLFAAVRAQLTGLIKQFIIGMYNIDPEKAAHAGVDELTHMAEEGMHEMEEKTSLESRMQKGGDLHGLTMQGDNGKAQLEARVGPVKAKNESAPKETWGTKDNPWVTVNPLPPSHSEISKDHPPHHHDKKDKDHWHEESKEKDAIHDHVNEKADEHLGHDHNEDEDEHSHDSLAGGSPFYELHRSLAVEADRHMMHQLEVCWKGHAAGDELIPGQKVDEKKMALGHDALLGDAKEVAGDAADRSKKAGFRHAQSDEKVPQALRDRAEVMQLLDLVDYFISHPSASTWWVTIFDNYIAAHGDEVKEHIAARNKTRGRRH